MPGQERFSLRQEERLEGSAWCGRPSACKSGVDVVYSSSRGGAPVTRRQLDYDAMAAQYDRRFVSPRPGAKGEALRRLAAPMAEAHVLEVGCGTGHWLAGLDARGHTLYGLDPSAGMLRQAQQKGPNLNLVRGDARQLPFASTSFHLVFCVNAIHHFDQPRPFVSEAYRVLQPGGVLAVMGSDPRSRSDRWYVYDFFEGTCETDRARFPPWEAVRGWMVAAGFDRAEVREVERICDPKWGRQVFEDPYLRKDACSQLALLDEEVYAAGLVKMEAALLAAEARGETLVFPAEFVITMLTGTKPGKPPAG
jgi:ubiquinone/menaquinone biosynthesis C-methylase UbiE